MIILIRLLQNTHCPRSEKDIKNRCLSDFSAGAGRQAHIQISNWRFKGTIHPKIHMFPITCSVIYKSRLVLELLSFGNSAQLVGLSKLGTF